VGRGNRRFSYSSGSPKHRVAARSRNYPAGCAIEQGRRFTEIDQPDSWRGGGIRLDHKVICMPVPISEEEIDGVDRGQYLPRLRNWERSREQIEIQSGRAAVEHDARTEHNRANGMDDRPTFDDRQPGKVRQPMAYPLPRAYRQTSAVVLEEIVESIVDPCSYRISSRCPGRRRIKQNRFSMIKIELHRGDSPTEFLSSSTYRCRESIWLLVNSGGVGSGRATAHVHHPPLANVPGCGAALRRELYAGVAEPLAPPRPRARHVAVRKCSTKPDRVIPNVHLEQEQDGFVAPSVAPIRTW
jgi:hypothetical protein